MKKSYIVGGVALLLVLGGAAYFYLQDPPPPPAPPPVVAKPVTTPAPAPLPPPKEEPVPEVKAEVTPSEPRWITVIKENKPSARTSQSRTTPADANWKRAVERAKAGDVSVKKLETFGYKGGL